MMLPKISVDVLDVLNDADSTDGVNNEDDNVTKDKMMILMMVMMLILLLMSITKMTMLPKIK